MSWFHNIFKSNQNNEVEMSVEETLESRRQIYGGSFLEQSQIAQSFKNTIHNSPNWKRMKVDQREAVEMIATKLSRILYGDPNYIDSWHDIAGYATLIEKALRDSEEKHVQTV